MCKCDDVLLCECCNVEVDCVHEDTQMCEECHQEAGINRQEEKYDRD